MDALRVPSDDLHSGTSAAESTIFNGAARLGSRSSVAGPGRPCHFLFLQSFIFGSGAPRQAWASPSSLPGHGY